MSPSALVEIEEKTQDLVHLDAVADIVSQIFALDVSAWHDESFVALETTIDKLIAILSAAPIPEHGPFIEKLLSAKDGVEQGVAPDPARRPTPSQMREFVSAHIS